MTLRLPVICFLILLSVFPIYFYLAIFAADLPILFIFSSVKKMLFIERTARAIPVSQPPQMNTPVSGVVGVCGCRLLVLFFSLHRQSLQSILDRLIVNITAQATTAESITGCRRRESAAEWVND